MFPSLTIQTPVDLLVAPATTLRRRHSRLRLLRNMSGAALLAVMVVFTGTPKPVDAASYNGPFGSVVQIGSATCWTDAGFDIRTGAATNVTKNVVLAGPSIRVGAGQSKFSMVKWTVAWYSRAQGATTWVREKDRIHWGTRTNQFGSTVTTWTFGAPLISINPLFRGDIFVYERLDYTNSYQQPVVGGAFDWVQPALATKVTGYAITPVDVAGPCQF